MASSGSFEYLGTRVKKDIHICLTSSRFCAGFFGTLVESSFLFSSYAGSVI